MEFLEKIKKDAKNSNSEKTKTTDDVASTKTTSNQISATKPRDSQCPEKPRIAAAFVAQIKSKDARLRELRREENDIHSEIVMLEHLKEIVFDRYEKTQKIIFLCELNRIDKHIDNKMVYCRSIHMKRQEL